MNIKYLLMHNANCMLVQYQLLADTMPNANLNNLPYSDRYFNTEWQFDMFKRGKPIGMILV